MYPTATCFLFRSAGPFLFLDRLFCPAVSDAPAKNWQECIAPLAGNTVPIKTEVISLKDKSFKRVLWLSPSERWRFCSAKPAPIPQERMLSLCESHGHKDGTKRNARRIYDGAGTESRSNAEICHTQRGKEKKRSSTERIRSDPRMKCTAMSMNLHPASNERRFLRSAGS